jgi:hypothetical protein
MASAQEMQNNDILLNTCCICQTDSSKFMLGCLHVVCKSCMLKQTLSEFCACPLCGFNTHNTDVRSVDYIHDTSSLTNGHLKSEIEENKLCNRNESENASYCHDCALVFTELESSAHIDHKSSSVHDVIFAKREYIKALVSKIEDKRRDQLEKLNQLRALRNSLRGTVSDLRTKIELRAQNLCVLINQRKYDLLNELQELHVEQNKIFEDAESSMKQENSLKQDSVQMTNAIIANDSSRGLSEQELQLTDTVANRIMTLADDVCNSFASGDIVGLKLDTPELGKERFHLEKLYGSLAKGMIHVANTRILRKLHVNLIWLTGLCVTKSKILIVIGKTGALESEGKVTFVDVNGCIMSTFSYEQALVPWCIASGSALEPDTVLVSDSGGQIKTFSHDGKVVNTWKDCFRTGGQMTVLGDMIMVSSTEHCIVNMLDRSGQNVLSLGLDSNVGGDAGMESQNPIPARMSADFITLDGGANIVIFDGKRREILLFNASSGVFVRKFPLATDNAADCSSVTGICCDAYGCLLVSDFTKDCVHTFSLYGQYLGQLIGKDKDLSCPTCLYIDAEGHLMIGQYGGDITVVSYVSVSKRL